MGVGWGGGGRVLAPQKFTVDHVTHISVAFCQLFVHAYTIVYIFSSARAPPIRNSLLTISFTESSLRTFYWFNLPCLEQFHVRLYMYTTYRSSICVYAVNTSWSVHVYIIISTRSPWSTVAQSSCLYCKLGPTQLFVLFMIFIFLVLLQ